MSVTSLGAAPASAAQVGENDYFKSIDVILSVDEVQQAAVSVPAADGVCRAEVMPDAIAINPSWITSTQCAIQLNYWSAKYKDAGSKVMIRFYQYATTGFTW